VFTIASETGCGDADPEAAWPGWLTATLAVGSMLLVASEISLLWPRLCAALLTSRLAIIAAETSFRISSILLRISTTSSAIIFSDYVKNLVKLSFHEHCYLFSKQTTCHHLLPAIMRCRKQPVIKASVNFLL